MPVPDFLLAIGSAMPGPSPNVLGLWAYFGLGPGQELIPYFLALLALLGTALGAVLQWPLLVLRRLIKRPGRDTSTPSPSSHALEAAPDLAKAPQSSNGIAQPQQ